MNPDNPRVEAIFHAAIELADHEGRAAFIGQECRDDGALEARVRRLIALHEGGSGLLESGACAPEIAAGLARLKAEEAGERIGPYKLLQQIGEGGFGTVWMAEQEQPVRRRLALKVIKLGMDTKEVIARFEQERQALAMMEHPNIAKVFDAGSTQYGRPFFVMELVRGVKLTDYCDEQQLSTEERLRLFIQVCQAVQHAHQKGIIHRDLKPSNILVTTNDGEPAPKVIDFGVAKATQGVLTEGTLFTQFEQMIGTPVYMSPEQAELTSLDIDTRSDIYSLGVLLYELLTGRTPIDTTTLARAGRDEVRRMIREVDPPRPSTRLKALNGHELTKTAERRQTDAAKLPGALSGDLDWIVMKCLEKDRKRRYETAHGLATDLKRHLNDEPVAARPPSAAYRFQKALRRNKVAFTAGASVVLALLLGLVISLWQYAGKSRAEREQSQLKRNAEAKAQEASDARQVAAQQRDLARERLCESLVREARSVREARQIGYRREVLSLLKQAIALETGNLKTETVHREIAACLGDWAGLDPVDLPDPNGSRAGALTTDGALAAIASWNGNVSLRETETGREVALLETEGIPYDLIFDRSGRTLFIALAAPKLTSQSRPEKVHVEKWSRGADPGWKREWARPAVGFTQFAPTAGAPAALVVGPADTYLAVMDAELETELARAPVKNALSWFPVAALSPDRRRLAFFSEEAPGSIDAQLEVWDLSAGAPITTLHPHLGSASHLSFGKDGQSLAATYENIVVVYDTTNFSSTLRVGGVFEDQSGGVIGGSAGLLAVPMVQELTVRLTHLLTGREEARLKLPGTPRGQSFSQDGSVLLLTHSTGSRIVHLTVEREKLRLIGHQGGVPAVEFSPDGRQLASAGKDRTLRLWDLAAPGASKILGMLPAPGQTLAYSPAGDLLVCGYYDSGELSLWSPGTGKQVRTVKANAPDADTTWNCTISPNGRSLAAVGNGLRLWDLAGLLKANPAEADTPLAEDREGYGGMVFDPAGKQLAYLGRTQVGPSVRSHVLLRGPAAGDAPQITATNNASYRIQGLTYLSQNGALAYVNKERKIVLLDPASGQVTHQFPTLEAGETPGWYVANLRASPDGSKLAMVTPSLLGVDLRDSTTGELLYRLPEEPGTIWWLAWSPDDSWLAVSRANGDISIWNLKEVGRQVSQLESAR